MTGDLGFTVAEHAEFLRIQAREMQQEATDPRTTPARRAQLVDEIQSVYAAADRMLEAH